MKFRFVLCQDVEPYIKYLAKKKTLYLKFAFDRVPWDVVWWALRKLGVEEWLVKIVQLMYGNARGRVRVNRTFSDGSVIQIGLY